MCRLRTPVQLLVGLALVVSLSACGLFGGNDEANLDGDLSWRVEGEEGLVFSIWRNQYTGQGEANGESVVFNSELSGGSASGDLEDGDFNGYELQASVSTDRDPSNVDLTLQLRSDGEVVEETSEYDSDHGVWLVRVGDVPDHSDIPQ